LYRDFTGPALLPALFRWEKASMANAVIYGRFSPRPSAETCDSVEKQAERCKAYCVANGYDVVAEYADKDASGRSADDRPGLQAAIAEACQRRAVLVSYDLSRLARNVEDARRIDRQLRQRGAALAFVVERIDTSTAIGRLMFTIFASFTEYQREAICERTSAAMLRHQYVHGRLMNRADQCPYGFRAEGKRLVEDPDEQRAIALIREQRQAGRGLREIARLLDSRGLPCRSRQWSHVTVRNILRRAEAQAVATA
jgi:site-specific DNA recombinase